MTTSGGLELKELSHSTANQFIHQRSAVFDNISPYSEYVFPLMLNLGGYSSQWEVVTFGSTGVGLAGNNLIRTPFPWIRIGTSLPFTTGWKSTSAGNSTAQRVQCSGFLIFSPICKMFLSREMPSCNLLKMATWHQQHSACQGGKTISARDSMHSMDLLNLRILIDPIWIKRFDDWWPIGAVCLFYIDYLA